MFSDSCDVTRSYMHLTDLCECQFLFDVEEKVTWLHGGHNGSSALEYLG